jgi:unsaturated chondroitin disaccharide hydrolase
MSRLIVWAWIISIFILAYSCGENKIKEEIALNEMVDFGLERSRQQAIRMAEELERVDSLLPRSVYKHGNLITSDSRWWCSGFFPGVLWYLYQDTNDSIFRSYAELFTQRVEREKHTTSHHDLGFILNSSFGNGNRIAGIKAYEEVLTTGAKSLITRFNPAIGMIKSWKSNSRWQYPVIVDNMMNLELLMRAAKYTGDTIFSTIAKSHADMTMRDIYRPDFSCYHVVSYDTLTFEIEKKQTNQGAHDESVWARGQAWGLYGFTMMFRETDEQRYLDFAVNIADFLIDDLTWPDDFIPYWDFDAPGIPDEPRDASTAAIMASALLELSQYVSEDLSKRYFNFAVKQIRSLTSAAYLADTGTNGNFILKHSTGSKPRNSEVDVPLTYADYYYVEALIRLKEIINRDI